MEADTRLSSSSIITVDSVTQMGRLSEDNAAALVVDRPVPTLVLDWLSALPVAQLPSGREILKTAEISQAVVALCDHSSLPNGPERDWFEGDVVDLATRFCRVMNAPYLRLRFDVVNTNACRKFHVDRIFARLICTYRGTGTQYGIAADGNPPMQISTAATGSPALLRGKLWPEKPLSGLLHRSPPIEGTGETRLVLVVDPLYDPTGEV